MIKRWIKPYEFWHPRIFELPFYLYLAGLCVRHRVAIADLARANYALDHGEIGIGSKYHTQQQFEQRYFLPTDLLPAELSTTELVDKISEFGRQHGYPLIVKPDIGLVGKGIVKLADEQSMLAWAPRLRGNNLLQKFTPYTVECGIFYCRYRGQSEITGINLKHFPTVVGNGKDSILRLAQQHYRYTHHWHSFLQYLDTSRVPAIGESVTLSFIGSHTMGCKFTDDTELQTDELRAKVFDLLDAQPGFNFGRLDVKTESLEALKRGEFVVIEVNGISSLPTHMFDPRYSIWDAYRIFFEHGKRLVTIAKEHRSQPMTLLPLKQILRKVKTNQGMLDAIHSELKSV